MIDNKDTPVLLPDDIQRGYAKELAPYLLTGGQVCSILLIKRQFLHSLKKRGRLTPAIVKGTHELYLDCDVRAYIRLKEDEGY